MRTRILDLDGALSPQTSLLRRYTPEVLSLPEWGPPIRMACTFGKFRRFAAALAEMGLEEKGPTCTLYGSGDFHHVSFALVQRLQTPCNLLVIDKHPDWMRGIPFLHCGTWLYHAAKLPQVRHVFHVGGEVDFDDAYRCLAPWPMLQSGKLTVWPARRAFRRGRWKRVPNEPLRPDASTPIDATRMAQLLRPFAWALAECPLYISVDKDVLMADEATVNWDSGHLRLEEVEAVLEAFLHTAAGNLAGMDSVGDWSPVRVRGALGQVFDLTMHPRLSVDAAEAARRNERINLALLDAIQAHRQDGHAA